MFRLFYHDKITLSNYFFAHFTHDYDYFMIVARFMLIDVLLRSLWFK
jgi:hypothetical protein